uniref:PCI domain-containing protein n=2 Tax=Alexandrium monilatum TaxID=311494 RepID=A0A7S4QUS6_9DINO
MGQDQQQQQQQALLQQAQQLKVRHQQLQQQHQFLQQQQVQQRPSMLQQQQQQQQQMQANALTQQMGASGGAGMGLLGGQQLGMMGGSSMPSSMTGPRMPGSSSPGPRPSLSGFGAAGASLGAAGRFPMGWKQAQQLQGDESDTQEGPAPGEGPLGGCGGCGGGCGGCGGCGGLGSPEQAAGLGLRQPTSMAQQVAMNAVQNVAFNSMSMAAQTPKMGGVHVAPPPWKQRPQGPLGQGLANGPCGQGTTVAGGPITVRPPGPRGLALRADTPAARLQLQQAQHEQRMLQQQGAAGTQPVAQWGTQMMQTMPGAFGAKGSGAAFRGPQGAATGPPAAFRGPQGAATGPPAAFRSPQGVVAGQGLPKPAGLVSPGGAGGGGAAGSLSNNEAFERFGAPPSLRRWLQKLFGSVKDIQALQKPTHSYLRHWVQQWVKTGELWQRNWDVQALPSPEEILANLPPGSLSGAAAFIGGQVNIPGVLPVGLVQGGAPRPKAPGVLPFGRRVPGDNEEGPAKRSENLAQRLGFDKRPARGADASPQRSPPYRSRSRSRRRSRTPQRRRRHRSPTSSRSRSRSGNQRKLAKASRSREASRSPEGSPREEGSPQRSQAASAWWGKGRGKQGGDSKRQSFEEVRERARVFLNERLEGGDFRGRQKELQEELQRTLGVNTKRFRSLFQQTLAQYVVAYHAGGPSGPEAAWLGGKASANQKEQMWTGPKVVSQGEQEMRAQRAARFQSHLEVERKPVSMVTFNEDGVGGLDGGPIVGELNEMCSRAEAKEREMTRQLDKFEWKQGTDPRHPEVNLTLATKKYQRSSADKAYRSQDVRNLEACWRTMEYLMKEILDFDRTPKPGFAIQAVPYIEVYSYLRDRTRSVRVDLHLQQPRSTTQRTFAETHECCLRFEMLSLFLLSGGGGGSTEKYDEKLGLKAISQTIEPLLNAYQAVRDKQLAKSILAEAMGDFGLDDPDAEQEYVSPYEMASHRYIILLLMSFSPEELQSHMAKLSRETLSHPSVSFATQVYAAFRTEDYGRFLRCYRTADFLTAVAMSGVVDLARLRALWLLVRTYPQPIGDKVPLSRIKSFLAFASDAHARSFLAFHGIRITDDPSSTGGAVVVLPKKGTPEAAQNPLLNGPSRLPEKCEFPKGADSMLIAKFEELGMSRADIVFGAADPVVEPEPAPPPPGAVPLPDAPISAEAPAASEQAAASAEAPAEEPPREGPEAPPAEKEVQKAEGTPRGPEESQGPSCADGEAGQPAGS